MTGRPGASGKEVLRVNILFFLTPEQDVAFLYDDFTLRQALEKMEYHRYSSIPMLNRKGEYVGTMTEGDLLWAIKNQGLRIQDAEDIPIKSIPRKRDYVPVTVNTQMDELVAAAMTQNFVPVLDDKRSFIGLVKRNAIIQYCYDQCRAGGKCRPALNKTQHKTQTESRV